MTLTPITLREANGFVAQYHRHHKPVRGCRFVIGAEDGGKLVGAIIVGRPVAPRIDWRKVAEVTRLTTDGSRNACSLLYAAAARAARAMGYGAIQTYILAEEPGTSLRAAGWIMDGTSEGGAWSHTETRQLLLNGQTRWNDHPLGPKQRWVKVLV